MGKPGPRRIPSREHLTWIPSPELAYDDLASLEMQRVRENNSILDEKRGQFLQIIRVICGGENNQVLDDVLNSVEFKTWYDAAQTNTAIYRLYTRHDQIHAMWATRYALEIVDILAGIADLKKHFSILRYGNVSDVKCAVMLASLWHDCGNAVARENHHIHSCILARDRTEQILKERYAESHMRSRILGEVLRCMYLHEKEAGECDNLEPAIIKVADGADCSIDRVGENGEKPIRELFEKGQALHIKGKIGIKDVKISKYRSNVRIMAVLDPNFMENSVLHPLQDILYREKILGIGNFGALFQIWFEREGTKKRLK